VSKPLVEKEGSLQHQLYHGSLCCQRSIQDAKIVSSPENVSNIIFFVLQTSLSIFDETPTVSNTYLNLKSQALL
jgi:hypothetical protein